jgi:hypothetical protein
MHFASCYAEVFVLLTVMPLQADVTRKRLDRAGKLTSALADEGVRWKVSG